VSATAVNWVVASGSALTALGIIWAAVRRTARTLIEGVRVVRQLLELQPRVVDLGERLVVLVEQQSGHGARLDRLESVVFSEESTHA
jgi:hypothetical protein